MSSERDRCNSRHFTWIMKTCFPNPHQTTTISPQPHHSTTLTLPISTTTISSLPDDVVLECLSRVPPSSLPSLSLVCRRWARLLHSPISPISAVAAPSSSLYLDTWSVVSHAQRRRYGCIGASVDGVFFIIGGLRIGAAGEGNEFSRATGGAEAHAAYASSMDLFDVDARVWLRSRAVPGGGCVVAGCAAAGNVYVLTSHAVELSFWKFDARRKSSNRGGGGSFGEWCRIKSPPFPAQVRMDTRMRFSCIGMGDKVMLIQVNGGADLPEVFRRAAYVGVEC
ncbi:hypothetical protein K1719_043308 [Acacia pycnantha]|nr:hypothetical protein K1719_043308 [Acacia pycnantha]